MAKNAFIVSLLNLFVRKNKKKFFFSFQFSNHLERYHLYSNPDYTQLPNEVISPLSKTTLACESGPDVGLVDIARHQSKISVFFSLMKNCLFCFRTWNFESQ